MTNRIALFTASGYDLISSPLINSVVYLSEQGYDVDVFAVNSGKFPPPMFSKSNVHYFPIKSPRLSLPGCAAILALWHIARLLRGRDYSFFIGYDPDGLRNAAAFGFLLKRPYVYHSLEIVPGETVITWRQKIKKRLERWLNHGAVLTITQDDVRADILVRENCLDRNNVAVVNNAPIGSPLPAKSSWLRQQLQIPEAKYIVLCVGSLTGEHLADEIAEAALNWPDEFVLVMHGWFSNAAFERQIRQLVQENPGRIYISTELLPHEEKYKIFQSADIGLAFYKPVNDNLRYVGTAAGKIFDFLRCGIPIICNDLPGMKRLVEDNGCGVLVSTCEDIKGVLPKVHGGYGKYSGSAIQTYKRYDFSDSYFKALEIIHSMILT